MMRGSALSRASSEPTGSAARDPSLTLAAGLWQAHFVKLVDEVMNAPPRMGIPLRPAREALAEMQMQALVRAAIATAATKLDPNIKGGHHGGGESGPHDRDVPLVSPAV
jgi:hypothetical protein